MYISSPVCLSYLLIDCCLTARGLIVAKCQMGLIVAKRKMGLIVAKRQMGLIVV
jgi:hypothetical protein